MEEGPTHSRQVCSIMERRREAHTIEEEETSESSTVADSMEALQKSMTLLMNSMLMEREARKWGGGENEREKWKKKKYRIKNLWKSKMKDMRQEPSRKKQD